MRNGPYDARKVDVWSAGATAWEMAEAEPPFMNMDISDPRQIPQRWPARSRADSYSHSFHDFLSLCSKPPSSRPSANDLLTVSPIRIVRFAACILIEIALVGTEDTFYSFLLRNIAHCGPYGSVQKHRRAQTPSYK